jgi:hypothetical protein
MKHEKEYLIVEPTANELNQVDPAKTPAETQEVLRRLFLRYNKNAAK